MKLILPILLLSLSCEAQKKKAITLATYTTAKLSDSMRYQRNRIDLLFWENKRLKERLDSAVIANLDQFEIDSNGILSIRPDAFMVVPRGKEIQGFKGLAAPHVTEDLKWQISALETLLDDDKKVIDKLQKIIDNQQAEIEKLKKKR